jgi:hypothetical protein
MRESAKTTFPKRKNTVQFLSLDSRPKWEAEAAALSKAKGVSLGTSSMPLQTDGETVRQNSSNASEQAFVSGALRFRRGIR